MKSKERGNTRKRKSLLIWSLAAVVVLVGIVLIISNISPQIPTHKKPNVVIILIDTLRADHCSVYGYNKETTPHMKRIAENSLKLENHFVNSPWTKPSTASIFSGLYPTAHGSRLGQFEDLEKQVASVVEVLNPQIETMAEILKENGYITHAFITNYHLTPKFGYAQGFDHYHFDPYGADFKVVCRKDKKLVHGAKKALRRNIDKPKFIWCHLMAVHQYRFPREYDKFQPEGSTPIPPDAKQRNKVEEFNTIENAITHYDNSILYIDRLVGEFFDFMLKTDPNTIFIITSDHGEEFYEHGGFEHSRTLYNEILKVPGIIWGPGVPTGVFNGLSDSIDLMPTILKNLGIKVSSDLKGQTLFYQNKIFNKNEKIVFAEQHNRGDYKRFAVIGNGKKMIISQHKRNSKEIFEFYHYAFSIEKENSITGVEEKIIEQFKQTINHFKKTATQYFHRKVGKSSYKKLTSRDIERLRSLGYIQ